MNIKYRTIQISDAENFYNLMLSLDNETKFMMYEPNERIKNIPSIEGMIKSVNENLGFFTLAIDADNGAPIGFISAKQGQNNRIRHTAYIVTGIRKAYTHKGIGTELFKQLDQWGQKKAV